MTLAIIPSGIDEFRASILGGNGGFNEQTVLKFLFSKKIWGFYNGGSNCEFAG